jgi:hypothetical protein
LYELAGAVEVCGLSEIDAEAEILRLENSALNGIEPRIPGIHSVPIQLSNGNQVIVMRIRKSWAQPHMVTFKGSSRFFSRGSAGKHQLDVQVGKRRGAHQEFSFREGGEDFGRGNAFKDG